MIIVPDTGDQADTQAMQPGFGVRVSRGNDPSHCDVISMNCKKSKESCFTVGGKVLAIVGPALLKYFGKLLVKYCNF